MPCYIFNEFIRACRKRRNITVWPKVIPEAYKDFGLWDEEAIITFIANDGIQKPTFQNSELWRGNPDSQKPIIIDSYRFITLEKVGYIAFFRTNEGHWSIKSLKQSTELNGSLTIVRY